MHTDAVPESEATAAEMVEYQPLVVVPACTLRHPDGALVREARFSIVGAARTIEATLRLVMAHFEIRVAMTEVLGATQAFSPVSGDSLSIVRSNRTLYILANADLEKGRATNCV